MADLDDLKAAEEAMEGAIHAAVAEIVSLHTQLDVAVKNNNMDQVRAVTARLMASNTQLRAVLPEAAPADGAATESAPGATGSGSTAAAGPGTQGA